MKLRALSVKIVSLTLTLLLALGAVTGLQAEMTRNAYPPFEHFASGRIMNGNSGFFKHNAELMFGKDPPDDKWQGFVKFDLTDIPEDAYITSVSIVYKVISVSNPGPSTVVTLLSSDPVPATAAQLWQEISSGPVLTSPIVEERGWVERPLNPTGVAAVQSALANGWIAMGLFKFDETETKGHVKGYQAGPHKPYLKIGFAGRDLGIVEITAPVAQVQAGSSVAPVLIVHNFGQVDGPFTVEVTIRRSEEEFYRRTVPVPNLSPGQSLTLPFPVWTADQVGGERVVRADLYAVGDANPANNTLVGWFVVTRDDEPGGGPGGDPIGDPRNIRWGWEEVRSVPAGPTNRPVRAGGALAIDKTTGLIYALKGNKTGEFAVYDPVTGLWRELAPVPRGADNRQVGKGAVLSADNAGNLYLVKGSNTSEFWRYDIAANEWTRLPDVLPGPKNRKLKSGAGLAIVPQYGTEYVYLLKGPGNELMRYAADANAWEALPDAPAGSGKWDKGSWLVYDGENRIYLHKAKKHEFISFDLVADAWTPGSGFGLPFMNSRDRVTRSKEGGSADWRDSGIWALKGGNTDEFWRWEAATGRWTEFEPMPKLGSTGKVRGVAAGGGLVSYPFAPVLFGLKGNKTLEFWRYTMKPAEQMAAPQPGPSGELAQPVIAHDPRIIIEPNPVVGNAVNLHYRLDRSGAGVITVFDPAGRSVLRQSQQLGPAGAIRLDLSRLSAGVYTVRLDAGGLSSSLKLVKTR